MAETTETKPPSTGERFFAWMRSLDVRREPGWIGGVGAGIGVRLGIDPLIVRGILVVVAVLGGPAVLLYAAAWLLLPDRNDLIHLEELIKGKTSSALAGIGVLVLLSLLPLSQGFWFAGSEFWGQPNWGGGIGRAIWTLLILAAAVFLVIWFARRGSAPSTTRPGAPVPPATGAPASDFADWREKQAAWKAENTAFRNAEANAKAEAWRIHHGESMQQSARKRAERAAEYRRSNPHPLFSLLVIGISLVAGGVTALSMRGGELEVTTILAGLAVALAVLAFGVVVNGVRGKRGGAPSGVAGILLLPLVFFIVVPQNSHVEYFSGALFEPTVSEGGAPDFYFIGSGDVVLDLTGFYDDAKNGIGVQTDDIYLFAGNSDVTVLLPEGASASVDAHIGNGQVYLVDADGDREGFGDNEYRTEGTNDDRSLDVRIYVGRGTVTIAEPQED